MKIFVWKTQVKGEYVSDPTSVSPPGVVAIPYSIPYDGIGVQELLRILLDKGMYVAVGTSYDGKQFVLLTYDERGVGSKQKIKYTDLVKLNGRGFAVLSESRLKENTVVVSEIPVWYSVVHQSMIDIEATMHLREKETQFSMALKDDKVEVQNGVLKSNGNDYLRKIGMPLTGTYDRYTILSKLKEHMGLRI